LAGYRGRETQVRFVDNTQHTPHIASYKSCTTAPDHRELLCRSAEGDVLGLDPITSQQRLIARLGLTHKSADPSLTKPVWWTEDGKLAIAAGSEPHAQCGSERCDVVGVVEWPVRETQQARLVPVAELPW
jgi:hypothetical protein